MQTEQTWSYIKAELNRMQTIAGTLSTVEREHHQALLNMGDDRLNQMAVEEQSASRQLGEMKQICLSLVQTIDELQSGRSKEGSQSDHV